MSCFDGVVAKNKKQELTSQIETLQRQIDDANRVLPETKQKCEEIQKQALQAKRANDAKHKMMVNSNCCFLPCFPQKSVKPKLQSPEELERLQRQLQDDLAATRAAASKVKAQHMQLEKAEKSFTAEPVMQMPFQKARTIFRSKTPAECRDMRERVNQLLEQFKITQGEVNSEKRKLQQASNEIIRQEAIAVTQEIKIRSNNRSALDKLLETFAEADAGKAGEIAANLKTEFNTSSHEQQREMKAQIAAFYSELVAEERKLLDATSQVHNISSRKPEMFSYQNSFAFKPN